MSRLLTDQYFNRLARLSRAPNRETQVRAAFPSVIIGNPPYDINQLDENENNKNRYYGGADRRIIPTCIKQSTAQKMKLYDMYARFVHWASDSIADDGVIAFLSNFSFAVRREMRRVDRVDVPTSPEATAFRRSSGDRKRLGPLYLCECETRLDRGDAIEPRQLLLQEALVRFQVACDDPHQIVALAGHQVAVDDLGPA